MLTWRGKPSGISLGLCALLVLSFGQSGHAVVSKATLAADWIHLASASIWFGGLATFATGLRRARMAIEESTRAAFTMTVLARFSAIALPAVIMIVASGLYGSLAHNVVISSLTATPYGRIIFAKTLLLVPLLALGFYHFRSGRTSSSRTVTVTLACAAALIVVIFALSALLAGTPAPQGPGMDHG